MHYRSCTRIGIPQRGWEGLRTPKRLCGSLDFSGFSWHQRCRKFFLTFGTG